MDGLWGIALMIAPAAVGSWSLYSRMRRVPLLIGMIVASIACLGLLAYRWSIGADILVMGLGSLASLVLGWGVFQRLDRADNGLTPAPYRHVAQESAYLNLAIDLIEGDITGLVKQGPLAGRAFESLSRDELRELAEFCVGEPASAWLMALSLKLKAAGEPTKRVALPAYEGPILYPTVDQAFAILGLSPGVSADQIKASYRRRVAELFLERVASYDALTRLDNARLILLGR